MDNKGGPNFCYGFRAPMTLGTASGIVSFRLWCYGGVCKLQNRRRSLHPQINGENKHVLAPSLAVPIHPRGYLLSMSFIINIRPFDHTGSPNYCLRSASSHGGSAPFQRVGNSSCLPREQFHQLDFFYEFLQHIFLFCM